MQLERAENLINQKAKEIGKLFSDIVEVIQKASETPQADLARRLNVYQNIIWNEFLSIFSGLDSKAKDMPQYIEKSWDMISEAMKLQMKQMFEKLNAEEEK